MPQPTSQPTREPSQTGHARLLLQPRRSGGQRSALPASPAVVQPTVTPDSCSGAHPGGRSTGFALRALPGVCAQAALGASNTLIASTPGTYKEEHWGCLASLNTGAGPAAAPRSPPRGNLPTTTHPRRTSQALGQPSKPPSGYQVQDCLALPPGRPSLRRLTLPPTANINCFTRIVLRFSVY